MVLEANKYTIMGLQVLDTTSDRAGCLPAARFCFWNSHNNNKGHMHAQLIQHLGKHN
jgi:hypothetical protein